MIELEEYLRTKVFLGGNEKVKPYEQADIVSEVIDPFYPSLKPTAYYALKENLQRIRELYGLLKTRGINIFNLEGIVQIDDEHIIAPPIIEVWDEEPYNGCYSAVDGLHRILIAREKGIHELRIIRISGAIGSILPVLPLDSWSDVKLVDSVPEDKAKRRYNPNIPVGRSPHEYYRHPLPGSTGVRSR